MSHYPLPHGNLILSQQGLERCLVVMVTLDFNIKILRDSSPEGSLDSPHS